MHESLLKVVTEVKQRIKSAERISLFLDFDGTLVPIEANPASPRLDSRTAGALQTISIPYSKECRRFSAFCCIDTALPRPCTRQKAWRSRPNQSLGGLTFL
jgi:hypothetical protein